MKTVPMKGAPTMGKLGKIMLGSAFAVLAVLTAAQVQAATHAHAETFALAQIQTLLTNGVGGGEWPPTPRLN